MKINKTVKGIAMGTSLAAFVTLGVPSIAKADVLGQKHAQQVGEKKKAEKKKDAKKDEKKKDEKKDEAEGSCGEAGCGDEHKDKDEKK